MAARHGKFLKHAGSSIITVSWIVTCPKVDSDHKQGGAYSWPVSEFELQVKRSGVSRPGITCTVCGNQFSLIEGLRASFVTDLPFVIHEFQSNYFQRSVEKGRVGLTKYIQFPKPFETKPVVYITSHTETMFATSQLSSRGFYLHPSKTEDGNPDEYECNWVAYGTMEKSNLPLWKRLIMNSKNAQLEKDFRIEIVELESAFEIFLYDLVTTTLRAKGMTEPSVKWISRRGVDEILAVWYQEATGLTPTKDYRDVHSQWSNKVKELRDAIVHRGINPTEAQAKDARGAVFDYIITIDIRTLEHFKRI